MDQQHRSFESDAGNWHHLGWRVLDARTYWVSHSADGRSRSRRVSESIGKTIRSLAHGQVWQQPPTFYAFNSHATIDYIAWCLKSLRKVKDTILIGSFTHRECRIVGPAHDSHVFDLVPFAKSAIGRPVSKRPDGLASLGDEEALYDFLRTLTQDDDAAPTRSGDARAHGAVSSVSAAPFRSGAV